jgi:hypothetical protein
MMGKSYQDLAKPEKEARQQTMLPDETSKISSSESSSHSSPARELDDAEAAVQWTLLDPLVKDLNRRSRYYLYHFANYLCAEYVVHDGPGRNPIRDLIPATSDNQLLLQVILANSAFHIHNLSNQPTRPSTSDHNHRDNLVAYYSSGTRFGGPFSTSYRDALVAKQQGLALLAEAVVAINPLNIDLILVSILLFINYDLIESGRDKWKVHMEGARRLIDLVGTPEFIQQPMSQLRTALLSDFLV